jgi:cytochrome P450
MSRTMYRPLPGAPMSEAVSQIFDFRHGPHHFFARMAATYGDICRCYFGPQPVVLLSDPEYIRRVLTVDHRQFKKGRFLEMAKDLLGEGLLTSEGELHTQQRRLIQPMFHRQMIRSYGDMMVHEGERARARWQPGQALDIAEEMSRLTLAIVGRTLFDADVEGEAQDIGEALTTVLEMFNLIGRPLALIARQLKLPTASLRRFEVAKGQLDATIYQIIADHRAGKNTRPDLIATLLVARDEDGDNGMSDQQIRDEALTLFLAGHETTANALAWTWHLLSQSPRVEAQLHQELEQVLAGRLPTVDDLPQLVYTRQILTESMRLFPPAWVIGRRALHDYELDGYLIPKGSVVVMSQWILHRDGRWFDEPLSFRPERWNEGLKQRLPKFAYFPFGGGPRNCIGEAFAWMEGVLLLATLAQHWRFQAVPGFPVEPLPLVTLRPKHGLRLTPQRR